VSFSTARQHLCYTYHTATFKLLEQGNEGGTDPVSGLSAACHRYHTSAAGTA